MIQQYDSKIHSLWYTDGLGNKVSVNRTNDYFTVIDGKVWLNGIPDKLIKISNIVIDGNTLYEANQGSVINTSNFTVDYENGYLNVDISYNGKQVLINSWSSRGSLFFPLSRIYDDRDGNFSVITTLSDLLDDIETNANNIVNNLADSFTHLGEFDPLYQYSKNNSVSYYGSSYIAIDTPPIGTLPTNLTYWKKTTQKGSSGSNLIYDPVKFVYSGAITYVQYELVLYNGNVYICKNTSTGNLPTNTTYFSPFFVTTSVSVSSYTNSYTITGADTNTVPIGISAFDKATDILMVFKNSVHITQTTDYTINSTSTSIVKTSGTWASATTFNFIVFKNVSTAYYADGRVLEPGTVPKSALVASVQNDLNKITHIVNVKNFGAVGDGVNDDTQAFKDAINAIKTNEYTEDIPTVKVSGKLIIPAGNYKITSTIVVPSYIHIEGDGRHTTFLSSYITNGTPVIHLYSGTPSTHQFYNTIQGFTISGRNQKCQGIKIESVSRWIIRDVLINITKYEGIYGYECFLGELYSVFVRGCGDATHNGIHFTAHENLYGANSVTMFGGEIAGCQSNGFFTEYGAAVRLIGVAIEGNQFGYGIVNNGSYSFKVDGCYFELNKGHVVETGATLSSYYVNNFFGLLANDSNGHIGITYAQGARISDNYFEGSGEYEIYDITSDNSGKLHRSVVENNIVQDIPITIDNTLSLTGTIIKYSDGFASINILGSQIFANDLTCKSKLYFGETGTATYIDKNDSTGDLNFILESGKQAYINTKIISPQIGFTGLSAENATNHSFFVDTADGLLKFKDGTGTIKTVTLT